MLNYWVILNFLADFYTADMRQQNIQENKIRNFLAGSLYTRFTVFGQKRYKTIFNQDFFNIDSVNGVIINQ